MKQHRIKPEEFKTGRKSVDNFISGKKVLPCILESKIKYSLYRG